MTALPPGVVPEVAGPGQESVWDYPRPPLLQADRRTVEVVLDVPDGPPLTVLRTTAAWRVLETSHPPTWYLPLAAAVPGVFRPGQGRSMCEWKGTARYLDIGTPDGPTLVAGLAWTYPSPTAPFTAVREHVALYPWAPVRCLVDGETVRAQPGRFYGGWVTDDVVGPFKGNPGSAGW